MAAINEENDVFRVTEKGIRQTVAKLRQQPKDRQQGMPSPYQLDDVIDVRNSQDPRRHVIRTLPTPTSITSGSTAVVSTSTIVTIEGHPPGLFIITNGLTYEEQLQWGHECLTKYSQTTHTNLTNLRRLNQLPLPTEDNGSNDDNSCREHKHKENDCSSSSSSSSETINEHGDSIDKLRWASLGYHYDWTARSYQPDNISPFPRGNSFALNNHPHSLSHSPIHPPTHPPAHSLMLPLIYRWTHPLILSHQRTFFVPPDLATLCASLALLVDETIQAGLITPHPIPDHIPPLSYPRQ